MRRFSLALPVLLLLALVTGVGLAWSGSPPAASEKSSPKPAAVQRTRRTVRMLDDLYKSAVVHITTTYVGARERTPAARAAKKIFKDMEKKGWHSARLIDATGEPSNRANVAKTEFEKRALVHLKKGKPYYDEVDNQQGKPVLRAATIVPAVMDQCVVCHPHVKKGQLMGAIIYQVPIR